MKRERDLIVVAVAILLWTAPVAIGAHLSEATKATSQASIAAHDFPSGQCGVRAVYLGIRSLGRPIEFKQLLRSDYIGSEEGSSMKELAKAARDLHVTATPMTNLTCQLLATIECPVVLHVRKDAESSEYRHWLLYMGARDDAAKIYDGSGEARWMPWEELAARWSGGALVLSNGPPSLVTFWITFAGLLAGCACVLGAIIVGSKFLEARIRHQGSDQAFWNWAVRLSALELIVLVATVGVLSVGYSFISLGGYLSHAPSTDAKWEYHNYVAFPYPTVTTREAVMLANARTAVFVDARRQRDFEYGHIESAINISRDVSLAECRSRLKGLSTRDQIVVYCQSSRCPYSRIVAAKLRRLGFVRIFILEEGLSKWQAHNSKNLRRDAVVRAGTEATEERE